MSSTLDAERVMAETRQGKLRGRLEGSIQIFRGIPYGGPVDGLGRFQAPQPVGPWAGVRDCPTLGPRAAQIDVWPHHPDLDSYYAGGRQGALERDKQVDSENCLVLNVLAPRTGAGSRPVMVYLHGGAFLTGSGVIALRGNRLVREQDVVLVSVNHRLNVFGFLYLGGFDENYAASGAAGLLDIVLALGWIRDNIAAFGGDPGNVTLFGESGGGWKISALLAMPAARGLFRRAIVESGSAVSVLSAEEGTDRAARLLKRLDIAEGRVGDLLALPASKLLNAGHEAGLLSPAGLWPVVDGLHIPRQPCSPDASPVAAGVAMIIGHCADEARGRALWEESLFDLPEAELNAQLSRTLELPVGALDEIIAAYRRNYPADTAADSYFRIASEWDFGVNATLQAERKLDQGDVVYKYFFNHAPPLPDKRFRAFHCAEMPLAMRIVQYPESEPVSLQLSAAWAAFARTGDPSIPGLTWPRYSLQRRQTMYFGQTRSGVVDLPDEDIRLAWRRLPEPRFPRVKIE